MRIGLLWKKKILSARRSLRIAARYSWAREEEEEEEEERVRWTKVSSGDREVVDEGVWFVCLEVMVERERNQEMRDQEGYWKRCWNLDKSGDGGGGEDGGVGGVDETKRARKRSGWDTWMV